jgi:hypothetical protein
MAPVIIIVAYGFLLVGGVMMLIEAFRVGVLWGLACLLLPIVSIFFLVVHWNVARKPFMVQLCGFALLVVGFVVLSDSPHRLH